MRDYPGVPEIPHNDLEKLHREVVAYERFFASHPKPSSADLLSFLVAQEVDLGNEETWRIKDKAWPLGSALSPHGTERYILDACHAVKMRMAIEKSVQELAETSEISLNPTPELDTLLEDLQKLESKFFARFADQVVGLRRTGGLLKVTDRLERLIAEHAEEEVPPIVEGADEATPTLSALEKAGEYQTGEFASALLHNQRELWKEAEEEARNLTEQEARELVAAAFNLDFRTYNEVFPKYPPR